MVRAPVLQEIETVPEADRLDGFPHPRATTALSGHTAAQETFASQFASGRMHHAWLLAGREGIGKATLAYKIARYALAAPEERGHGGPNSDPLAVAPGSIAAGQVRALSHPGLMVIRRPWDARLKRFTTSIPIDEVRRIKSFLAHASTSEAWRIVIVDRADELNINAANALLKSLEEPPARTLFLLITAQPGELLPTIRSRCRRLELSPLADQDLLDAAVAAIAAAEAVEIDVAALPQLTPVARGSVRRLLMLARSEGVALHGKLRAILSSLPALDWLQVHSLADEVTAAGADQRFEQLLEVLTEMVSQLVRARALGAAAGDDGLAERLIARDGLATWAELWETVQRKRAETSELNLDRKALLLETFAMLQAAARS
jgi:DNA polymerase III subunit delta'